MDKIKNLKICVHCSCGNETTSPRLFCSCRSYTALAAAHVCPCGQFQSHIFLLSSPPPQAGGSQSRQALGWSQVFFLTSRLPHAPQLLYCHHPDILLQSRVFSHMPHVQLHWLTHHLKCTVSALTAASFPPVNLFSNTVDRVYSTSCDL
jgi:hypothetical protein